MQYLLSKNRFISIKLSHILQYILTIVLVIIVFPVFILISIAIILDSPGPIFFLQKRIGKKNKTFQIYKFRSFKKNTIGLEPSPINFSDPRLSKIGILLRRYSIDELPQLLNILKGDMYLVGPRAITEEAIGKRVGYLNKMNPENKDLNNKLYRKLRSAVKPGITGLTQIRGRSNVTVFESISNDIEYIKKQTLLLDLKIIFRTPYIMLRGIGNN